MSAQAGVWSFDGKPTDQALIQGLSECLKVLGPDGESCCVDGPVAMLYRPFHTTAESRDETQPFLSPGGSVLTWDGRLDNREALIAELGGDLGPKPSDIAIVAGAFDRWGTNCFRRIVGDWAVSIWQRCRQELIFAADYMAVRHIFYYLRNDGVMWSTDLSALLLLSGDTFHLDDNYIAGFFALGPDADLSPYVEIREVPPGQFVRIRNRQASVERYWRFDLKSKIRYKTDAEYEEHFRSLFWKSVRRRLRSDSPVLAELSGGLDSSAIVCVADDILAERPARSPRLDTISYYDNTEPHGDDSIYFRKVEQHRGRTGAHIDASTSSSPSNLWQCPAFEPLPGRIGFGCQMERDRAAFVQNGGYRVVLSGIGGDEFLGGIPDPSAQLADLIVQFRPLMLARQLLAWSLAKRRPWIHLLGRALIELLPLSIAQYVDKHAHIEPWIKNRFARRCRIAIRQLGPAERIGTELPTQRSCVGGVFLMANRLAKCRSLRPALEEGRYPFLDQDLIEFILAIPADQLLRPGERRSLMRRALAGIVPNEILSRKTKQFGARTPILALEKSTEQLKHIFTAPLSARLGYINPAGFVEQLDAISSGRSTNIVRILKTVSLEYWLRELVARHLIEVASAQPLPTSGMSLEASA
jgi:asparagine synthase (glutamine-hydrolysing)